MTHNRRTRRRAIPLVTIALTAAALVPGAPLQAQEILASLNGTITDVQGAVIPGVTVTALDVDTNVAADAVTDARGGYRVLKLQPGRYRVTAALAGFKTQVREGIVLRTAETGTVDMQLSVGTVEEVITVTGALSGVESNQSVLAQTMENKLLADVRQRGEPHCHLRPVDHARGSRQPRAAHPRSVPRQPDPGEPVGSRVEGAAAPHSPPQRGG